MLQQRQEEDFAEARQRVEQKESKKQKGQRIELRQSNKRDGGEAGAVSFSRRGSRRYAA